MQHHQRLKRDSCLLAELLTQNNFSEEYQRHERARFENQALLENRLEEIQQGGATDILEPFAKAYLGMFYDVDNNIPPASRIYLLVEETSVKPIIDGLVIAVQTQVLPGPAEIARALINDDRTGLGYIALAGFDLFLQQQGQPDELNPETIKAIICFHYANSTYHQDDWLDGLLQKFPQYASEAFIEFWQVLRGSGLSYLPGLQAILEKEALESVRQRTIVRAASLMRNNRHKELARILLAALISDTSEELYATACDVLQSDEDLGIRQQVYWQATAFILEPSLRVSILSAFMGQEKIKILPLLDFINWVLVDNKERLSGEAIGELIRIIAPKFTPQTDNYGNLSDISLKVAWLFYLLATKITLPAMQVTKKLRRVRVLKLYNDVLDEVDALQQKLATDELAEAPDADNFIHMLHSSGKLRSKKKMV